MSGLFTGTIAGLIVGGATVVGALPILKKTAVQSNAWKGLNLDFAIGMMLAAAAFNLIAPAYKEGLGILPITVALLLGIFSIRFLSQTIHNFSQKTTDENTKRASLFVIAMMLHNFPEGLAAGVSLHSGVLNPLQGWSVILALVVQNLPEGLATAFAFKSMGMKKSSAFYAAALTGGMELLGGALGGSFRDISTSILPMTLAFAGGAMISVTLDEVFVKMRETKMKYLMDKSFISGFMIVLAMNALLN